MQIIKYTFLFLISISLLVLPFSSYSQHFNNVLDDGIKPTRNSYDSTFKYLCAMLENDSLINFKKAVFSVENTFLNGSLNYDTFNLAIKHYSDLVKEFSQRSELIYEGEDKENFKMLGALFIVMTSTKPHFLDSGYYFKPNPFIYDFDDFWGENDWTQMFVSKLLNTHKGNCHSLPYLYKIIADELDAKCYLSFAPNHTYIKAYSQNPTIGWYNTELTNATFPVDAWIKSSGYIHLDAIKNGLYMDTLTKKHEIAVCIIDLAKGYERLFNSPTDNQFLMMCADTALKYYPNYVNAQLLKAETMKKQFENRVDSLGASSYSVGTMDDSNKMFEEMQSLYFKIFKMGYRTMPKEMYIKWLTDLNEHKEKYFNTKLSAGYNSN